jgi:hypothetical protein
VKTHILQMFAYIFQSVFHGLKVDRHLLLLPLLLQFL